jgi:hypothetical protein
MDYKRKYLKYKYKYKMITPQEGGVIPVNPHTRELLKPVYNKGIVTYESLKSYKKFLTDDQIAEFTYFQDFVLPNIKIDDEPFGIHAMLNFFPYASGSNGIVFYTESQSTKIEGKRNKYIIKIIPREKQKNIQQLSSEIDERSQSLIDSSKSSALSLSSLGRSVSLQALPELDASAQAGKTLLQQKGPIKAFNIQSPIAPPKDAPSKSISTPEAASSTKAESASSTKAEEPKWSPIKTSGTYAELPSEQLPLYYPTDITNYAIFQNKLPDGFIKLYGTFPNFNQAISISGNISYSIPQIIYNKPVNHMYMIFEYADGNLRDYHHKIIQLKGNSADDALLFEQARREFELSFDSEIIDKPQRSSVSPSTSLTQIYENQKIWIQLLDDFIISMVKALKFLHLDFGKSEKKINEAYLLLDIKPENIVYTETKINGNTSVNFKMIDFGSMLKYTYDSPLQEERIKGSGKYVVASKISSNSPFRDYFNLWLTTCDIFNVLSNHYKSIETNLKYYNEITEKILKLSIKEDLNTGINEVVIDIIARMELPEKTIQQNITQLYKIGINLYRLASSKTIYEQNMEGPTKQNNVSRKGIEKFFNKFDLNEWGHRDVQSSATAAAAESAASASSIPWPSLRRQDLHADIGFHLTEDLKMNHLELTALYKLFNRNRGAIIKSIIDRTEYYKIRENNPISPSDPLAARKPLAQQPELNPDETTVLKPNIYEYPKISRPSSPASRAHSPLLRSASSISMPVTPEKRRRQAHASSLRTTLYGQPLVSRNLLPASGALQRLGDLSLAELSGQPLDGSEFEPRRPNITYEQQPSEAPTVESSPTMLPQIPLLFGQEISSAIPRSAESSRLSSIAAAERLSAISRQSNSPEIQEEESIFHIPAGLLSPNLGDDDIENITTAQTSRIDSPHIGNTPQETELPILKPSTPRSSPQGSSQTFRERPLIPLARLPLGIGEDMKEQHPSAFTTFRDTRSSKPMLPISKSASHDDIQTMKNTSREIARSLYLPVEITRGSSDPITHHTEEINTNPLFNYRIPDDPATTSQLSGLRIQQPPILPDPAAFDRGLTSSTISQPVIPGLGQPSVPLLSLAPSISRRATQTIDEYGAAIPHPLLTQAGQNILPLAPSIRRRISQSIDDPTHIPLPHPPAGQGLPLLPPAGQGLPLLPPAGQGLPLLPPAGQGLPLLPPAPHISRSITQIIDDPNYNRQ